MFEFIFRPVLTVLERIEGLVLEVIVNQVKGEIIMSATQDKLDELKGVMAEVLAKVNAVFDAMQEAKDDPVELQALIDQGRAATGKLDEILNPAPPTP